MVVRGKDEVNLTGQFARSMTVMNFARCGGEMAVPPRSATCPSWMQSSIHASREAAPLVLEATRRASWWRRRRGMDGDIMPAGDEGEAREECGGRGRTWRRVERGGANGALRKT